MMSKQPEHVSERRRPAQAAARLHACRCARTADDLHPHGFRPSRSVYSATLFSFLGRDSIQKIVLLHSTDPRLKKS